MKINKTKTKREILIPTGTLLVSRTDLKGIITYVNDEFIKISGFTRDELVGKNHNILRHPNMDSVEFKDLWNTLKTMRTWQGLLKNKTKSGDIYWTEVIIVPVLNNGKVHEYLSVQRAACREKVEQKEQLHRLRNSETPTTKKAAATKVSGLANAIDIRKQMAFALALFLVPIFHLMHRLWLAQDYRLLAEVAASTILASIISVNVIKRFSAILNKTINIFYHLTQKRFGYAQELARKDLIGDFERTLYSMEVNLDLAQAREETANTLLFNRTPGEAHLGVMIGDNSFDIVYMENNLLEMFKKAGAVTPEPLPKVNNDKPVGTNNGNLSKPPVQPACLSSVPNEPYNSELHIAGQVIRFSINS